MTLRKTEDTGTDESTRSHSLENSVLKRLWDSHKTDCTMNTQTEQ